MLSDGLGWCDRQGPFVPLITRTQTVALLRPWLPEIDALIRTRCKQTGSVTVPLGELVAVQNGVAGGAGKRGPALRFWDWQVEALIEALRQREEALRQAQTRRMVNPQAITKTIEWFRDQGDRTTVRFLEKLRTQAVRG